MFGCAKDKVLAQCMPSNDIYSLLTYDIYRNFLLILLLVIDQQQHIKVRICTGSNMVCRLLSGFNHILLLSGNRFKFRSLLLQMFTLIFLWCRAKSFIVGDLS